MAISPIDTVQRAWVLLHDRGPRTLIYKILDGLGYRRVLVLVRSLDEPVADVGLEPGTTIGVLCPGDRDAYHGLRGDGSGDEFASRLAAGDRCFAARRNSEVLSVSWASDRQAFSEHLGLELPLEPGEVYVYDSYTDPGARGRGLSPAIRARMIRRFKGEGYRRIVTWVAPENAANLRALDKVGFRPVGALKSLRIGPWRRDLSRAGARPSPSP